MILKVCDIRVNLKVSEICIQENLKDRAIGGGGRIQLIGKVECHDFDPLWE